MPSLPAGSRDFLWCTPEQSLLLSLDCSQAPRTHNILHSGYFAKLPWKCYRSYSAKAKQNFGCWGVCGNLWLLCSLPQCSLAGLLLQRPQDHLSWKVHLTSLCELLTRGNDDRISARQLQSALPTVTRAFPTRLETMPAPQPFPRA